MRTKIAILTATQDGLIAANLLNEYISEFIYLESSHTNEQVAGKIDKKLLKNLRINKHKVSSYDLTSEKDVELFSRLQIDILLVIGWQRLVPESILNRIAVKSLGAHGSISGITQGRGRSPQNWAIMMGATEFDVSLFTLDPYVDSGEIIASKKIEITNQDDINSLHVKVTKTIVDVIRELITNNDFSNMGIKQRHEEAGYFPARQPEDGLIDFNLDFQDFDNYVRALCNPYPQARFLNGNRLFKFNRVYYVSNLEGYENLPNGYVISRFSTTNLLVKISDCIILIDDLVAEKSDAEIEIPEKSVLIGANIVKNIQNIISRHSNKYPNLDISIDMLAYYKYLISKYGSK